MFIVYYDESGDDGTGPTSSPLFALTAAYLHHQNWQETYGELLEFRRWLRDEHGIPVKTEIKGKNLLLNKKPYRQFNISDNERIEIITRFCELFGSLKISIINTVINVRAILMTDEYDVLDNALKYSIQRIENDLQQRDPGTRFMIITDEGRIGKMRKTARKIQKFNWIPSRIDPGTSYRREIRLLIEDPIGKNSKQSYFIQMSDIIVYIVYLHKIHELGVGHFPNRLPVNHSKIIEWLDLMENSLNLEASREDPYGIVCYPNPI